MQSSAHYQHIGVRSCCANLRLVLKNLPFQYLFIFWCFTQATTVLCLFPLDLSIDLYGSMIFKPMNCGHQRTAVSTHARDIPNSRYPWPMQADTLETSDMQVTAKIHILTNIHFQWHKFNIKCFLDTWEVLCSYNFKYFKSLSSNCHLCVIQNCVDYESVPSKWIIYNDIQKS